MENAKECLLDKDEVEKKCLEYAYYKKYLSALPGSRQLMQSSHKPHQLELVCNSSVDEGDKSKAEGKLTPRRRRRRQLLEALRLRKGRKVVKCSNDVKSSTENESLPSPASAAPSSSEGGKSKRSKTSFKLHKPFSRKFKRHNLKSMQKPEIKVEDWSGHTSALSEVTSNSANSSQKGRAAADKGEKGHGSSELGPFRRFLCKLRKMCSSQYLWIGMTLALAATLGYTALFYLKTTFDGAGFRGGRQYYYTPSYVEELPFHGAQVPFRTETASLLGLEDDRRGQAARLADAGSNRYVDDERGKYDGAFGHRSVEERERPFRRRISVNVWRYRNDRDVGRLIDKYKHARNRLLRERYFARHQPSLRTYNDRLRPRHFQDRRYNYEIAKNIPKIKGRSEKNERIHYIKNKNKNLYTERNLYKNINKKRKSHTHEHIDLNNIENIMASKSKFIENENNKYYLDSKSNNARRNKKHRSMNNETFPNTLFPYTLSTEPKTSWSNENKHIFHIYDKENSTDNKMCFCHLKKRFRNYRKNRKPLLHMLYEKVFHRCYPVCCVKKKCCEKETVERDMQDRSAKNVSKKCPCSSELYNLICISENPTSKPKKKIEYPTEFYSHNKPFPFSNSTMGPISKIHGANFYNSFKDLPRDKLNKFNEKSNSGKIRKDLMETNDFPTQFGAVVDLNEKYGHAGGWKPLAKESHRFEQNSHQEEQLYEKKLFQSTSQRVIATVQPTVTIGMASDQQQWFLNNRKLLSYNADEYSSTGEENEDESDVAYDTRKVDVDNELAANGILNESDGNKADLSDEKVSARNMLVNVDRKSRKRMLRYRADDRYKEEVSDVGRRGSKKRKLEVDGVDGPAISGDIIHTRKGIMDVHENDDKASVRNGISSMDDGNKVDQDRVSGENGISEDEYDNKEEISDDERLSAGNGLSEVDNSNEADIADEAGTNVRNGIKSIETSRKDKISDRTISRNRISKYDKSNKAVMSHDDRFISRNRKSEQDTGDKARKECKSKASIKNVFRTITGKNNDEEVDNDQNYKTDMRNDHHKLRKSFNEDVKSGDSENDIESNVRISYLKPKEFDDSNEPYAGKIPNVEYHKDFSGEINPLHGLGVCKKKRSSVNENLSGIALSHDGDAGRISREGIRIFGRHDSDTYNKIQSNSGPHVQDEDISSQNAEDDKKYDAADRKPGMFSDNDGSNQIFNRQKEFYNTQEQQPVYIRNHKRYNLKKPSQNANNYWNKQSKMQKFKTVDVRNDIDENANAKSKTSSYRVQNENGNPYSGDNDSADERNELDKEKALGKSETSTEDEMDIDFDTMTTKSSKQTSTVSKIDNFDSDVNLNAQDYSDYGVLHDTRTKAVSDGVASDPSNMAVMSVVVHKSYGTVDIDGMKRLRAREEHITYLPKDRKLITGERNPNKLLSTLRKLQPIANKTILYDRLISYPEPQNRNAKRDAANTTYSYNDICKKIVEYKIQENIAKKRNQKTKPNDDKEDNLYLTDSNKIDSEDQILDPDVRFRVRSLLSVNIDSEEFNMTMKSLSTLNSTIILNATNLDSKINTNTDKSISELNLTSTRGPLSPTEPTILTLNESDSDKFKMTVKSNDQMKMAAENLTANVTFSPSTVNFTRQNITDCIDRKKVVKRDAQWDWGKKGTKAITKRINLNAARDYAKFVRLKLKMQKFNEAKSAESMLYNRNFDGVMGRKRRMRRRYGRRSRIGRRRYRRPTRLIKRNALQYLGLGDRHFERPAFMKIPFYRQSTSTPASQPSDDAILQEALTGQQSARIVDQILQEARNNHHLNTMFGDNQRVKVPAISSLEEYVGAPHFEDTNRRTRTNCTKPCIVKENASKPTPCSFSVKSVQLMGNLQDTLLRLIEEQVRVRTCLKLPPELETFLRELTSDKRFMKKRRPLLPGKLGLPRIKHTDTNMHSSLSTLGDVSTAKENRS